MSIHPLTAVTPATAGTKSAQSGDKPQDEISFSAVLADRRRTNTVDASTNNLAKDAGRKHGDLSARAHQKQQAGTHEPAGSSAATLEGTSDARTAAQAGAAGADGKHANVRVDGKLSVDSSSRTLGKDIVNGDQQRASDTEARSLAKIAESDLEADAASMNNDTTVFADISWNTIAISMQHDTARATAANPNATDRPAHGAADTRAIAGVAPPVAELPLSAQAVGQTGNGADTDTRTLDARALQTAGKGGDAALRLSADSDALIKQGEDAFSSDRARIALASQGTATDARSPAAWAAFSGDVFQQGRGGRFASNSVNAEASDAFDLKSLPGTVTTTQAAPGNNFAASTPPAMMNASVNAPLGSEAWKQAINQQALRLSHVGDGAAELTLYPRELGQLHVSLKMGEHAQLHFASAHADVRAAVEAALPQLRHAFAESGINLGQTSVSDQGTNSSNDNGNGRAQGRTTTADTGDVATADTLTAPVAVTTLAGRTLDGGIDIFA